MYMYVEVTITAIVAVPEFSKPLYMFTSSMGITKSLWYMYTCTCIFCVWMDAYTCVVVLF